MRCGIRQCSIIFRKTLSGDVSGIFVYISVLDIVFQDDSKIGSFYMLSFFSISTYNEILSQVYALPVKLDHGCMNVMDICYLYCDSTDNLYKYEWLFILPLICQCTVFLQSTKTTNYIKMQKHTLWHSTRATGLSANSIRQLQLIQNAAVRQCSTSLRFSDLCTGFLCVKELILEDYYLFF